MKYLLAATTAFAVMFTMPFAAAASDYDDNDWDENAGHQYKIEVKIDNDKDAGGSDIRVIVFDRHRGYYGCVLKNLKRKKWRSCMAEWIPPGDSQLSDYWEHRNHIVFMRAMGNNKVKIAKIKVTNYSAGWNRSASWFDCIGVGCTDWRPFEYGTVKIDRNATCQKRVSWELNATISGNITTRCVSNYSNTFGNDLFEGTWWENNFWDDM